MSDDAVAVVPSSSLVRHLFDCSRHRCKSAQAHLTSFTVLRAVTHSQVREGADAGSPLSSPLMACATQRVVKAARRLLNLLGGRGPHLQGEQWQLAIKSRAGSKV